MSCSISTVEAGDAWKEAITYNDIACHREQRRQGRARASGDPTGRSRWPSMTRPNHFALAVIHSTRADIELRSGNPASAARRMPSAHLPCSARG